MKKKKKGKKRYWMPRAYRRRNKVKRHFASHDRIARLRLPALLLALGMARRDAYRRRNNSEPTLCWRPKDRRNEWALKEVYCKAYALYRNKIKYAHPDLGGSHEEAAFVNGVWQRIKYLLKRRGLEL